MEPLPLPAEAVADLLGLVAYAELAAFDRLAADARLAPDLHRRAVLSEMAAGEVAGYRRIADRLTELGGERGGLTGLITAGTGGEAGVPALLRRLTAAHTARTTAVGLNN